MPKFEDAVLFLLSRLWCLVCGDLWFFLSTNMIVLDITRIMSDLSVRSRNSQRSALKERYLKIVQSSTYHLGALIVACTLLNHARGIIDVKDLEGRVLPLLVERVGNEISRLVTWGLLKRIAGGCGLVGTTDPLSNVCARPSGRLVLIVRLVNYDAPTRIGGVWKRFGSICRAVWKL